MKPPTRSSFMNIGIAIGEKSTQETAVGVGCVYLDTPLQDFVTIDFGRCLR